MKQLAQALTKQKVPGASCGSHFNDFAEDMYFKGANGKDVPNFVGLVLGTTVAILVNRPEPCEQIFQSKNKYFDKHPRSARIGKKLLGNSILFAKSDVAWQRKRKALSAALYKEKVKQMLEMIKNVTMDVIENEWMEAKDQTIDMVTAASKIFFKVTLQGFFGGENSDVKV